jgi:heme-degrading monooxygenase HmoA
MICRQWRGLARSEAAMAYQHHLRAHTFPAIREIDGFVDAAVLRRSVANGVEFLVVTRWKTMGAIEKFAGADPNIAVVPANVREMMLEYDEKVRHYEVVEL